MRRIKILLAIFLGVVVFHYVVAAKNVGPSVPSSGEAVTRYLQRLATVIDYVKKYYYKAVDDETLFSRTVNGMLNSLDPHSSYLESTDLNDLKIIALGKFGGIGIEFIPDRGAIKVISPLDDTPAYRAGIKAGDYIIQINTKLVRDISLKDAVSIMRGKPGSRLSLTVIRKNEKKPIVLNLRREIIKIKAVKDRILEPGYGYIRVAVFQEPTGKDVANAVSHLKKLSKGNLKGLILDVRNNPGGLFESAVQVADNFLDAKKLKDIKDNSTIVYTKGRSNEVQMSAKATPGDLLPGIPLVVLINDGSASASEIVAGALQDHKRAIVIGTRSFGKGSVQTLIPIDKNSAIKLTTALYYTPLGRSIQAKGIEPDINVEDMRLSVDDAAEQNIPRIDEEALVDHIQNQDTSDGSIEQQQKRSKQELELARKDYQLYEALHILKSQNVMRRH